MNQLCGLVAGGLPCFGGTKQPKNHQSDGNAGPSLPTAANPAESPAKTRKNSKRKLKSEDDATTPSAATSTRETRRRTFGEILIEFFCCCCCCGRPRQQPRNSTETKVESSDEPALDLVEMMPLVEPCNENDPTLTKPIVSPDSNENVNLNLLDHETKPEKVKDHEQDSFKEDQNMKDDDEMTTYKDNEPEMRESEPNELTTSPTIQSLQNDDNSSSHEEMDEDILKMTEDCIEKRDSLLPLEILCQESNFHNSSSENSDKPQPNNDPIMETAPPVPVENFDQDSAHEDLVAESLADSDHTVDIDYQTIKIDHCDSNPAHADDLTLESEQKLIQNNESVVPIKKSNKKKVNKKCEPIGPLLKALQESDPEKAAALKLHIRKDLGIPDGCQYPYNDICEYFIRSNYKTELIPEFIYPVPIQPDPLLDLMNKMIKKKEKEKAKIRKQKEAEELAINFDGLKKKKKKINKTESDEPVQ